MKKTIGQAWEQLPDTKFFLQCQDKDGMRIIQQTTQPTTLDTGVKLKDGQGIDTDMNDLFEGICWIRSEFGENKDYWYQARP